MALERAIFEEVFDGPDSLFGRVFGPSRFTLRQAARVARAAKKPAPAVEIHFNMSNDNLIDLAAGGVLRFKSRGQTFTMSLVD
jgi:hypothetical protein